MKRKVCVVITARPSYARIQTALDAIRIHPDLELQVVVAASALLRNYGEVVREIEARYPIAAELLSVVDGLSGPAMAKTTGLLLIELATTFAHLKPDCVVTIADRAETLATAMAGRCLNIPVVHVQGGERSGSIDDSVRDAVTQLADFHCAATNLALNRIAISTIGSFKGAPMIDDTMVVTGCPSIDLARIARDTLQPDPQDRIVVMFHPVTTEGDAREQTLELREAVLLATDKPVIWFWPNVDAHADDIAKVLRQHQAADERITYVRHMPALQFYRLLLDSTCLVGNSSVGLRECAYLGVPVVNVGSRQAGRERCRNVQDCQPSSSAIHAAIMDKSAARYYPGYNLYGEGNAGKKIAIFIAEWLR